MPKPDSRSNPSDELYTTVSDEQFEDLMDLSGQQIVQTILWNDSMANALDDADALDSDPQPSPTQTAETDNSVFDLDVYLKDGVYFELFGVQLYPSLDSEPLSGYDTVKAFLTELIAQGLWLDDLGVDEDDGLVLILCRQREPLLYIPAGAWFIDEWDELPDDSLATGEGDEGQDD